MPCFRLLGTLVFCRFSSACFDLVACALLPQAALAGARFEVPDHLLRLPEQTYRLIEHNFSTLYHQQTGFTRKSPAAISSLGSHRFAGIPLSRRKRHQMEVFGQLYNDRPQICR